MRSVSDKVVKKIKTHILNHLTFFPRKHYHLWDNVENYCRAGQATDDNIRGCIKKFRDWTYRL